MSLSPLPVSRLADAVEARVCDYIRENGLRPGDPLPKEIELASRLNVSRNIVREALSRLRMLGVVDSRKRRGMIVSNPDILGGLERVIGIAAMGESTARELFQLRLVMEIGLADLVFPRRTEASLVAIERIVIREEERLDDRVLYKECDIQFHAELYKMAGNEVISRFQNLLAPYFELAMKTMLPADRSDPGYCTHRGLLDVLRTGTPSEFRDAMRRHLKQPVEYFCGTYYRRDE